jgi:hypothetical protein
LVLQQAVQVVVVIERVAELVQVVAEQAAVVEQVVDLNSDLFDFLPFLFNSRK